MAFTFHRPSSIVYGQFLTSEADETPARLHCQALLSEGDKENAS
jgi:hypothetical protein